MIPDLYLNLSIVQLIVSGTTGHGAHALSHVEVALGLIFVHRRMQLYTEVTNALDLRLSLKVVMSRSAQVSSVLNYYHIYQVTLGWFIFLQNNILIVIYLYFS